jgi:hypothetical protein
MIILFAETAVSLGKHTVHKQEAAFLLIIGVSNTQSAGHIWPPNPELLPAADGLQISMVT